MTDRPELEPSSLEGYVFVDCHIVDLNRRRRWQQFERKNTSQGTRDGRIYSSVAAAQQVIANFLANETNRSLSAVYRNRS